MGVSGGAPVGKSPVGGSPVGVHLAADVDMMADTLLGNRAETLQCLADQGVPTCVEPGGSSVGIRLAADVDMMAETLLKKTAETLHCLADQGVQPCNQPGGSPVGVRLAADVDIRADTLQGKRVAIVGAGMTGATLALTALRSGVEHVTLILRRTLQCRLDHPPYIFVNIPGFDGPHHMTIDTCRFQPRCL
jgi:hypothetical protein